MPLRSLLIIAMALVCHGPSVLSAQDAQDPPMPTITVTAKVEASLDRRLFGGFLERPTFSDETGPEGVCDEQGNLPPAVVGKLRELGTHVVRFPGGTGIDFDDWTDLISAAPGRSDPQRPLTKGHQGGEYSNRFGIDEFFALRAELGFEALLVANLRDAVLGVKSVQAAAEHAAGLLAYCVAKPGSALVSGVDWGAIRATNGHPEPYPVPLFAVGNETWFYFPPKPAERERLGLLDDDALVQRQVEILVAYADALHAVSPDVKLIVDGLHDPWSPDNRTANILRRQVLMHPHIRSRYTYVTVHQYFPMGMNVSRRHGQAIAGTELSDDEAWYGLLGAPGMIDEAGHNTAYGTHLDDLIAAGYRIAATEWNWNGWGVEKRIGKRPFNDTLPMALGAAGYLNGLIRQAQYTDIGCQSMMLGTNWGITAIRAPAGQEPWFLPQGEVLAFYNAIPGDRVLTTKEFNMPGVAQPVQFASWCLAANRLAFVDAVAIGSDNGVSLCIVQRQRSQDQNLRIQLDEQLPPIRSVQLRVLSGAVSGDFSAGPVTQVETRELAITAGSRAFDVVLPAATVCEVRISF